MNTLPDRPNLSFLLREAKALKSRHRARDTSVREVIGHFDTRLQRLGNDALFETRFSILDAQRVTARRYGFSSWPRLKRFVQRARAGECPSDPTLRALLLDRHARLLELQSEARKDKAAHRKDAYAHYRRAALESVGVMDHVYEVHGWPGPNVVGTEGLEAAVFLAANAVYDAEFQHRSVRLMGEALQQGGFIAARHAVLVDRNLALAKRPTRYGSTFGMFRSADGEIGFVPDAVEHPDRVDHRRATVGLEPMQAERQRSLRLAREENWDLPTFHGSVDELNHLSVDGGYRDVERPSG